MAFLPVINVADLFPVDLDIQVFGPFQHSPETVTCLDTVIINSFVRSLNPSFIVEFGTAKGRTALNMAMNASADTRVISIDNLKHVPQFTYKEFDKRIIRLILPSTDFNEKPGAGLVDFIFIDGSHEYSDVVSDSRKAMVMVKPGGVILWHDYHDTQPGVVRALNELYEDDLRFSGLQRIIPDTTLVYCRIPGDAGPCRELLAMGGEDPWPEDCLQNSLRGVLPFVTTRCRLKAIERVYLYGAGSHTQAFLPVWLELGGPEIQGILVTEPGGLQSFVGIPVIPAREYKPEAGDAIVLSSHTFESEMAASCKQLWPNIPCYALYNS